MGSEMCIRDSETLDKIGGLRINMIQHGEEVASVKTSKTQLTHMRANQNEIRNDDVSRPKRTAKEVLQDANVEVRTSSPGIDKTQRFVDDVEDVIGPGKVKKKLRADVAGMSAKTKKGLLDKGWFIDKDSGDMFPPCLGRRRRQLYAKIEQYVTEANELLEWHHRQ